MCPEEFTHAPDGPVMVGTGIGFTVTVFTPGDAAVHEFELV
jgi:hypothetical protein